MSFLKHGQKPTNSQSHKSAKANKTLGLGFQASDVPQKRRVKGAWMFFVVSQYILVDWFDHRDDETVFLKMLGCSYVLICFMHMDFPGGLHSSLFDNAAFGLQSPNCILHLRESTARLV